MAEGSGAGSNAMTLAAPVEQWDSAAVCEWLKVSGLEAFVPKAQEAKISGKNLLIVDTAALERMQVDGPLAVRVNEAIMLLKRRIEAPQREDFLCHICMDLWVNPITAMCGHTFCRSCLAAWLLKNPTCPIDRRELPAVLPEVNTAIFHLTQRAFPVELQARMAAPAVVSAEQELERARREAEERERKQKLTTLSRHFRGNGVVLDDAALEAVLAVCDGDVAATIAFLELQGEPPADFVDVRDVGTGNGAVPRDYSQLPAGLPALPEQPQPHALGGFLQCFTDSEVSLAQHIQTQTEHFPTYRAVLRLCIQRGIDLTPGVKAKVLAAAWARRDYAFVDLLLGTECRGILDLHEGHADVFGTIDILKALRLLDNGRQIRVLQKKLAKLEGAPGVSARKVQFLRTQIAELEKDRAPCSLSGALAKHVRAVIARIPASKLEFFALQLPGDPWREICDLLHIHPTQGTTLPWFLPRCFGDAAPADSVVTACLDLTPATAAEIIERFHPPYSYLRLKVPQLPAACRSVVARYTSLDQCLWWYEDLQCDEFDAIVLERLRAGERPTLSYGKLMERLMLLRGISASGELFRTLMALAEQRLQGMRLSLPPPVVILGDASYSMDVAIRVSVIMASLLAVLTQAELRFFNTVSFAPSTVPHTAAEVLDVAATTRADGPTAPACALWEYFSQRRPISTFIVVTDERENTKSHDTYFPALFRRYVTEVHPARLVLVSFLEINTKGQMATALQALGIQPLQFSLDGRRPDLTRLDGLLGLLASSTENFPSEVEAMKAV